MQRHGGRQRVRGGKRAAVEQHRRDRHGERGEPDGRGQHDHVDQPQREPQAVAQAGHVAPVRLLGQARQHRGAERGHEYADRKLEQPAGVPQPGDAPFGQQGRHLRTDDQVELIDPSPEDEREQQHTHAPQSRMARLPTQTQRDAAADQRGHLPEQLTRPADHHAPGQTHDRLGQPAGQRQGARDHRHVEQHRGERRRGEVTQRVQDAHGQSHAAHEEQIDERRPRQADGERELVAGVAGGEQPRNRFGQQYADAGHYEQHAQTGAEIRAQHAVGPCRRTCGEITGDDGHEGRRGRALADQAAEQVGDPKRHEEGVGRGPGPEHGADDHVADEAEHAAQQGQAPDLSGCADDLGQHGIGLTFRSTGRRDGGPVLLRH